MSVGRNRLNNPNRSEISFDDVPYDPLRGIVVDDHGIAPKK